VLARRLEAASGDAAPIARVARLAIIALVRATAPTADELAALGDGAQPRVMPILGPAGGITQRATQSCGSGNSIHVFYNDGLLAFRPLRAGTTRALVAQLVAFDRDGHAHVTPLVESIELRLGDSETAPACVVEAGDDGALRPAQLGALHARPPFVVRADDGVACSNCHTGANTMQARDIAGDELARIDAARTQQVDRLAVGLWRRLEQ